MSESTVKAHAHSIFKNKIAVAAIMGNIDVETGGTFDFEQKQIGGGPGRGLFQMEKPMWDAYQKWLDDRADSAENQLKYVHNERKNGHHIGAGHARKIRDAFESGDVDKATTEFCNRFERPNPEKSHLDRRLKSARKYAPPPATGG